jgi:hypothetical protein
LAFLSCSRDHTRSSYHFSRQTQRRSLRCRYVVRQNTFLAIETDCCKHSLVCFLKVFRLRRQQWRRVLLFLVGDDALMKSSIPIPVLPKSDLLWGRWLGTVRKPLWPDVIEFPVA